MKRPWFARFFKAKFYDNPLVALVASSGVAAAEATKREKAKRKRERKLQRAARRAARR